ncbi:ATP-binding protein [Lutispora thermophila]|uniref:histidine kinase n=1 Tax=Lutispora thermophila DSM 19022 TaxID=1122184 RepID=A0A1M6GKJ3_9FIRM|nr:sensor histidine kinase [Lutispora thermophila]SHJ10462.1 two-component system, sensor histidine kinase YcbA [Lutispora thermophila DSM 19022]
MSKNIKEMFIVAIFTAMLGQINFYPFGTEFRITIAVIIFPFLLMYFRNLTIADTAFLVAVFVLITRVVIDLWFYKLGFEAAFIRHMPSSFFYICYGITIDRLKFRANAEKPLQFLLILIFADIASNFLELILRKHFISNPFESILETVVITALIRSTMTLCLYWIIKSYNLIITKEEHQRRYHDLLLITAKMKSEIFFLKKSMQDIENAMSKSYGIYNKINDAVKLLDKDLEQIKSDSLELSIQIHEIKKDYNRIVLSMEKILPAREIGNTMKISDIFNVIQGQFIHYIESLNKDIKLSFKVKGDYDTDKYFIIISILNNLIQNSIEACIYDNSYINVISELDNNKVIFRVIDNGKEIPEEAKELIFEPGYTSKYDPNTGLVSTGLGLAHVKMLTEYLNGTINVKLYKREKEFTIIFSAEEILIRR